MNSAAAALAIVACLTAPFGRPAAMPGSPPAPPAAAAQQTAREILLAHEAQRRTRSDEYVGALIVTSKNGTVRRKEWKSYHEGWGAASSRLIRFLSPPDIRGVGYLRRQRPGQPLDEWLYLPTMQRERRIVQSDRQAAFVGTDFSYDDLEDLEVLNPDDYDVASLPDRVVDGEAAYAIELHPRGKSDYQKKVIVIGRTSLNLLALEYYRKSDRGLSKVLTLLDYQTIDAHHVAMRIVMTDVRKGSKTELALSSVALDRPQPADRYTIQNLVREDDTDGPPLAFGARPAWAPQQGTTPAAGRRADPPSPRIRASFTGALDAKSIVYAGKSSGHDSFLEGWASLVSKGALRIGPVRLSATVRVEDSSSSREGKPAFDPADRAPQRSPLSLRDAVLAVTVMSGVDFQAGRLPIAWGQTDHLSPADAFLPRDTTDPLVDERLALWGAQLRGERGGVRFEMLATATTTPWRLPALDGRHSPLAPLDIFLVDYPSSVPRRGFEFARIAGTTPDGWDLGGWARTGLRPAPILELHKEAEVQTDAGTFLPIGRRYVDETGFGAQISHPFFGWLAEGEISYLRSKDADLGDALIWSVTASHPVRNGTFVGTFAMNSIATPVDPLLLFDRALLPAFLLGVRQSETWGTWKAGWLGTFHRAGGLLTVDITRNLTDRLKLTCGGDVPHGDAFSPARAFAGNVRARLGIRWEW